MGGCFKSKAVHKVFCKKDKPFFMNSAYRPNLFLPSYQVNNMRIYTLSVAVQSSMQFQQKETGTNTTERQFNF